MRYLLAAVLTVALLIPAALCLAGNASLSPGSQPLPEGSPFPELSLEGSLSADQLAYLGLAGNSAPWSLSDIDAEVLVIEIFSMYCPHCQAEAPVMDDFYKLVASEGLDGRIKVMGVGVGNSDYEVDVFRKKFTIPYPLFNDPDFVIHKQVGEPGTPYFYVIQKRGNASPEIIVASLGRMDSPQAFLDKIRSRIKK